MVVLRRKHAGRGGGRERRVRVRMRVKEKGMGSDLTLVIYDRVALDACTMIPEPFRCT